ncbi:hypothetical protein CANINC_000956 [Pichia inconspicua]|uniref:Pre-rRNA-processing protein RIX1 N-terminal domain-containing protein n=1 Tax=Pichia inconspicua TaxID=52247 RepID=A0A4T0X570_9ASCO|nr:hypothetical protein CANINC_000956 [[Candida] inconspicua]
MNPDLQSIIPYIQEDKIDEFSFKLLLQLIANPSVINYASTVDQQTLFIRIITLLKSNHSITRWRGTKLLTVALLHPVLLLSANTGNAIVALVKILETKCFINNTENPTEREIITLKSTVECIGFILDQIRGKPTLTREVLTPKLPHIIGALVEVTDLIPRYTLPVLNSLLTLNTTTFRPFGTKFENVLKNILNNGENLEKVDDDLRISLMRSLALVSFILSREKQGEKWRENVNDLILELKSVISIYEALVELTNDDEYKSKLHSLPNLPQDLNKMNLVFGTLNIDINNSATEIFKVSQRIHAIVDLLVAYIEINPPTAVSIPLGHYVILGEILASFNTSFTPIKSDIRDQNTRKMIEQSLVEAKHAGVKILKSLIKRFGGNLFPYVYEILAILDASIPVTTVNGKIKVDKELVYQNEAIILNVLDTAALYLSILERFNDMTVLGRLVESAIILKDTREPNFAKNTTETLTADTNVNKQKKKGGKGNKNVVSISDILSHKELFLSFPSQNTLVTIRSFFNTLITKCELSPGKLNIIVKFVIIDAIANMSLIQDKQQSGENEQIVELLENMLLFPGKAPTSITCIPLIANLIGKNSKIYSLLVNPRFPLLQTKQNFEQYDDEEEESEDEEEGVRGEQNNGDSERKVLETDTFVPKRSAEDEVADNVTKRQHVEEQIVSANNDFVFDSSKDAANTAIKQMEENLDKITEKKLVEDVVIAREEIVEDVVVEEESEDDDDLGSDFEIPAINVDDD